MQQSTITLIVAAVGIIGTLGGVLIGHLLTRSWQQKQWLRDRRSEEFKELLNTLVQCSGDLARFRLNNESKTVNDALERATTSALCYQTLVNRIYIAKDVERLNLIGEWSQAISEYTKTNDTGKFGDALRHMRTRIVETATEEL